ncbi:hypothetical protein EZS27_032995 [termite gut metagenome]|uniref:Transposase DDE domain-containing protein n=1 Tax=termite gut metagenome TaxID=433724 RepID=A0A5J4Q517_9ZZZZ
MSTLPTSRDKDTYKVRNWKAYNSNLRKRGSLRQYLEDSVLKDCPVSFQNRFTEKSVNLLWNYQVNQGYLVW